MKEVCGVLFERINDLKQQIIQRPFGQNQTMSTVRLDVTPQRFETDNLMKAFLESMSEVLKVPKSRFEVSSVRPADELELSVFIDFLINEGQEYDK
tara:strand:+ start:183 stop:470 length:288 start_codon:yes stop_codon:yes gene_type:complete